LLQFLPFRVRLRERDVTAAEFHAELADTPFQLDGSRLVDLLAECTLHFRLEPVPLVSCSLQLGAGQFHQDAAFALLLHHRFGHAQLIDALPERDDVLFQCLV